MNGPAAKIRVLPYALAFFGSLCVMILELVASRLVARHVGASLNVWTSVIGIMLGGICLGNFLGGRLADRSDPSMAIGPLYAIASALTLGCLWLNPIGRYLPADAMPDWLRTVSLVSIDFLLPGTILGMIGPVLAKIAVEHARRAGSAIGDVYTLGAVGSIVGTFLAGYVLMYLAPTSTIITLVAAGLALMSAGLIGNLGGAVLGLGAALLLGLGSIAPMVQKFGLPSLQIRGIVTLNPLEMVGHGLALMLGVMGVFRLRGSIRPAADGPSPGTSPEAAEMLKGDVGGRVRLGDLAALSFAISLAFMAFEMAAGRLVARHLGSSIYGWTSIIGVLLGGLSLGNFLGGKLADFVRDRRGASWLFVAASALLLSVLFLETPPKWFAYNPIFYLSGKAEPVPIVPGGASILKVAMDDVMDGRTWGVRVFLVVLMAFFLPSVALGTVSPVLAKLAVDRVRFNNRTGGAIGSVYAWGMVGSILGTFLTGFLLIDVLGTKGVLLSVAALLAVAATIIGSTSHAIWAGISLGLCIIAFVPIDTLRKQAYAFGLREKAGNLDTDAAKDTGEERIAYIDESNYYYIKVEDKKEAEGRMRTLVLDNLIHGYFLLGHPERLDYDYEHIYAQVADRVARARAKPNAGAGGDSPAGPIHTLFLGGGAYTFQRYILDKYPGSTVDVAEIDPAVLKANHAALGLADDTPIVTHIGDARQYVEKGKVDKPFDIVFGDAFNDFSVPWHLTTREFNDKLAAMMAPDGVYMINIIDKFESDERADKIGEKKFLKAEEERNKRAEALKKNDELITKDDAGVVDAESTLKASREAERARALTYGGFLGSWVKTARLTFPHIYVFGTDNDPGYGLRETFVVVASKAPLDLDKLGTRPGDPKYAQKDGSNFEPLPVPDDLMKQLDARSRGIVLTDDYAPVENLLAPVARTRGSNDD